jgi:membrane dipeptidase
VEAKTIAYFEKHKEEKKKLMSSGKKNFEAIEIIAKKYQQEYKELQSPFHLLFDHLAYIIKLAGIDHVGLGGDFDGISVTPQVLTDASKYPLITKELIKRGYSKRDIKKILGGNFIRVFKANQM